MPFISTNFPFNTYISIIIKFNLMIIFGNLSSSNPEMTPHMQNIVCDNEFGFNAPPTAKVIWRRGPQLKVSSDRLEKPRIEHGDANPDLRGEWFILYYKILYTEVAVPITFGNQYT